MQTSSSMKYHLLALVTSMLWGSTFVSTKILINNGLSPAEILVYRFSLAYICIWLFSPKKIFAENWRDELLLVLAGMAGGSLYFLFENTALEMTLASNVALIICTAPLLTALAVRLMHRKEKLRKHFPTGSLIAITGVALVVFNGHFVLRLSPLGDTLTLLAAISWALYSIIVKKLDNKYPVLFITRKVFIYGILTLLPSFLFRPVSFNPAILSSPVVLCNLIFLGVFASMLCYIMWNLAVKNLGAIRATNYIYINPLVALVTAYIALNEDITSIAMAGGALILVGVYVAERGFHPIGKRSELPT